MIKIYYVPPVGGPGVLESFIARDLRQAPPIRRRAFIKSTTTLKNTQKIFGRVEKSNNTRGKIRV